MDLLNSKVFRNVLARDDVLVNAADNRDYVKHILSR